MISSKPYIDASEVTDECEMLSLVMQHYSLQDQFRIFQDYYRAKTVQDKLEALAKWADIAWK